MRKRLEILRRERGCEPYWQTFAYETENAADTAATALTAINEQSPLLDETGHTAEPIRWECSCLQKKCGACAMVVNGRPALACAVRLADCGDTVRLEPLRKFPVVEDLIVDRSVMHENLKTMKLWFDSGAVAGNKTRELAYDASRCLQCGCCLEVCPNFAPGEAFTGMAAAVPMARLLLEMPPEQRMEATRLYRRHVFEGCGKSLACRSVCPVGIDIDGLLVNSNALAVWKRFFRK